MSGMRRFLFPLLCGATTAAGATLLGRKKQQERDELRIRTPRGVELEEFVPIGGIEQYLHHRGKDVLNPVMLFLHGGPGSPELPFANQFQPAWEHRLTIVHWDQRGCGKTFARNHAEKADDSLSMELLLSDLHEIVAYLKGKYHKDRIILMGHSWGTVLGSVYAHRHPENVLAYIGVGQVVNMQENERVGFQKVLEAAAENEADQKKLRALEPYPGTFPNMMRKIMKVRQLQIKYKLADGVTWENAKAVLTSPFYSVKDATWFLRPDVLELQRSLYQDLFDFDLPSLASEYSIPFYIIQGEDDYQTPYPLAKAYFDTVSAPVTGFYSIPSAGHFTMADQKQRFNEALFRILGTL